MSERVGPGTSEEDSPRSRIVRAASAVLASRGSHAASIKEIAREAQVAPGLVHYYFASKGELLLEVVRQTCRSYQTEMAAVTLPGDPVELTRALLGWSKRRSLELPDWYRLLVDLDALALRDAELAREVAVLKREVRGHIAASIALVEERLGAPIGPGRDALAAVVMVAVDGMVIQKLVDPSFDVDAAFAALETMLVELIQRARR
jgi:AcrR family transcriptional regulator